MCEIQKEADIDKCIEFIQAAEKAASAAYIASLEFECPLCHNKASVVVAPNRHIRATCTHCDLQVSQ